MPPAWTLLINAGILPTLNSTNYQLQTDLNKMYNWSVTNNMLFNASKFQSICYSSHASVDSNFIYKDHEDNPIAWFDHVKDLGIYYDIYVTKSNIR